MIKKILVPIDGSETAWNALKYAVDLARQTVSSIILVSVVDRSPYFGAPTVPSISTPTHLLENMEDYLRQAAEAYVLPRPKSYAGLKELSHERLSRQDTQSKRS